MINITRQSPVLSLLMLMIISIISMVNIPSVEIVTTDIRGIYGALLSFQANHHIASLIISGLLIVITGFNAAHLSAQYNLFAGHSTLTMPIYGMIACSITLTNDYLVAYLSSFLLMLAIKSYYSGYKLNSYGFSSIFSGSIILGLMPYIHPAFTLLLIVLPFVIFIFKRSTREVIVAISGLIFPSLVISYILWLQDNNALSNILIVVETLKIHGNAIDQLNTTLSTYIVLGTYILLSFVAYVCYLKDRQTSTRKARRFTILNTYITLCTIALFFIPSSTISVITLLAIPVSILIPIVLVRVERSIALVIYLTLLILWALNIVIT